MILQVVGKRYLFLLGVVDTARLPPPSFVVVGRGVMAVVISDRRFLRTGTGCTTAAGVRQHQRYKV
jgi:hypothetical protein